jgi:hypothetical protein
MKKQRSHQLKECATAAIENSGKNRIASDFSSFNYPIQICMNLRKEVWKQFSPSCLITIINKCYGKLGSTIYTEIEVLW